MNITEYLEEILAIPDTEIEYREGLPIKDIVKRLRPMQVCTRVPAISREVLIRYVDAMKGVK